MTTTPNRGPLDALAERLAVHIPAPAAIDPAEVLEHLGDLGSAIETLAANCGTHYRAFAGLAGKLDNGDDKGDANLLFHVAHILETLERDADAIVASLYAITAAGRGDAR